MGLTEAEEAHLNTLRESAYGDDPCHQLGGLAFATQWDTLDELATVIPGDWRLLLQVDSDEHLNVVWHAMGQLHFWILEADARAQRFDRVRVSIHCLQDECC